MRISDWSSDVCSSDLTSSTRCTSPCPPSSWGAASACGSPPTSCATASTSTSSSVRAASPTTSSGAAEPPSPLPSPLLVGETGEEVVHGVEDRLAVLLGVVDEMADAGDDAPLDTGAVRGQASEVGLPDDRVRG